MVLRSNVIVWFFFLAALHGQSSHAQETLRLTDASLNIAAAPISAKPAGAKTDKPSETTGYGILDYWDDRFKETRAKGNRFALLEYAFDNRGFNILHAKAASPLPFGFSFFGFIDMEGADLFNADRSDLAGYFLELDLKKQLWDNGGAIWEYNDLAGGGNETGRFGFYHRPQWKFLSPKEGPFAGKGWFQFKFLPLDTQDSGQFSFAYFKSFDKVADGRLSFGGFYDLNYDVGSRGTVIVSEHKIRFRLAEGFHFLTEFRYNGFSTDKFGIAPGFQYRF